MKLSVAGKVLFIDPCRIGDAELGEWRELAGRAAQPNIFFEPEFMIPAARHLGGRGVRMLVVRDTEGWVAAVPVRRQLSWRLVPMPALVTWRHLYCFLGTPLVDGERLQEAVGDLVEGTSRAREGLIALEWVGGGAVERALIQNLEILQRRPVVYSRYRRAAVKRREEPTYLDERRGSHHRREEARKRRNLARDLDGDVVVEDRAGDPAAVEDFLRLEASGWKGHNGTALSSNPSHAAFFRDVCAGLAERGKLELLAMRVEDRLVAMTCNFRTGDTLFCFKIAHDETLGRYSPGIQLGSEVVARFHATPGLELIDSCTGSVDAPINAFWPDRRTITTLVVPRGGIMGRIAQAEAQIGASVERRIRQRRSSDQAGNGASAGSQPRVEDAA